MINRKTSPPHPDLGAPRPAHLGHGASELLLAPCSWFPPFGNKLVEMRPQVGCSPDVLRQECWDLCSPQTTLPWIPHTSLHRTSTQVVRTISGWSRGVASTKSSLGSSPSCGVTVIASRERAWCPGPPPEALVSSVHISDQAGFSSSFDPKVFRRVISPHLGGHGLVSLWCSPSLAHVWICCILVQALVQQH